MNPAHLKSDACQTDLSDVGTRIPGYLHTGQGTGPYRAIFRCTRYEEVAFKFQVWLTVTVSVTVSDTVAVLVV